MSHKSTSKLGRCIVYKITSRLLTSLSFPHSPFISRQESVADCCLAVYSVCRNSCPLVIWKSTLGLIMPSRPRHSKCYCTQCGPLGSTVMSDTELLAHQESVRKLRMSVDERPGIVNANRSRRTTGTERQALTVTNGTRAERGVITSRAHNLLSSIKTSGQIWLDKASASYRGRFDWREAKLALDSLTNSFTDIKRNVPSLDALKDEVSDVLDSLDKVLEDLREDFEPTTHDSVPIVHDSRES